MIRYLSLFSGIGAFEKALDNLGIPYELLAYCEVDKYASKAYFRLMGFSGSDYELLAKNGISKTQIYKMAGNSIVVTVLEHLFKQIYTPGTQSIDSLKKKSLDILNTL